MQLQHMRLIRCDRLLAFWELSQSPLHVRLMSLALRDVSSGMGLLMDLLVVKLCLYTCTYVYLDIYTLFAGIWFR